jgi:hypothetical protein
LEVDSLIIRGVTVLHLFHYMFVWKQVLVHPSVFTSGRLATPHISFQGRYRPVRVIISKSIKSAKRSTARLPFFPSFV